MKKYILGAVTVIVLLILTGATTLTDPPVYGAGATILQYLQTLESELETAFSSYVETTSIDSESELETLIGTNIHTDADAAYITTNFTFITGAGVTGGVWFAHGVITNYDDNVND